jgi:hypothetical protein
MIRDRLIPALKREFAGWEITFDEPPQPIAVFAAAQRAVGRVIIYDDGDEATVLIEKVTHSHFNPYDEKLSEEQRDERVTEDVIDFLKALFSDRVLLYSSPDNRRGGWTRLDSKHGPVELSPDLRYFLWSRPYEI